MCYASVNVNIQFFCRGNAIAAVPAGMVYAFNIPEVIRSALEKVSVSSDTTSYCYHHCVFLSICGFVSWTLFLQRRYIVYETHDEDDDDFFEPEPRPEAVDRSDILSDEVQQKMEDLSLRGLENHERTRAKFRERVRFMREWEGEQQGPEERRPGPHGEEQNVSPEGIPMMGNVQGEELTRKQRDFLKQRKQAVSGPDLPKEVAENPVARYFVRERMRQRGYSSDRS